jgi:catechol 2,3-dioxygenase-like lactoylglutathione lyase family enzyme
MIQILQRYPTKFTTHSHLILLSCKSLIYFLINLFKPTTAAMEHNAKSLRPFIGARDFNLSRSFYRDLGFEETVLSDAMSVFKTGQLAFYLQNAYVKDWIDNTMLFLEVDDADRYWTQLAALKLPSKYEGARLTPVRVEAWGKECFLHDPSGILWHFGQFF